MRSLLFRAGLVLDFDHEAEGLRGNDDLLERLAVPRNGDAVVGCRQLRQGLASLPALDGLGVEDDLGEFVLVMRRLGATDELRLVFRVRLDGFAEVGPVGQATTDGLFRGLGIVQVLETVEIMDGINHLYQAGKPLLCEPSLSQDEVATVVQVLGLGAETDDLRGSLDGMALDEDLAHAC